MLVYACIWVCVNTYDCIYTHTYGYTKIDTDSGTNIDTDTDSDSDTNRHTFVQKLGAKTHGRVEERTRAFICVPWLVHMCAMAHSYVCHDSTICVPWLIHMCAMTHSYVCHESFIFVPWLIHICAMTRSYACHDSFIYGPCAMTHSHACHASFIWVPWVIQIEHQDQITPPLAYIPPHGVLGKSKNASSLYVHATALFAPALSARSFPFRQFVCVSYCICIFTHTLVRWASPPPSTHKGNVRVYAYNHTDQHKKTQTKST